MNNSILDVALSKVKICKYDKQALDFLAETKTSFEAVFTTHGYHFKGDKETIDIYTITLSREGKKPFIFKFGHSLADSGTIRDYKVLTDKEIRDSKFWSYLDPDYTRKRIAPTAYDVLSCLSKYDVGSFDDFCTEFGYDNDNMKVNKTYLAIVKEYNEVKRLWTEEEIEKLQEID